MKISIQRVCVPTDFSEPANHAFDYGLAFAQAHQAELLVLHVVPDIEPYLAYPSDFYGVSTDLLRQDLIKSANDRLDKLLQEKPAGGAKVTRAVRYGTPAHEIHDYAADNNVDLLVIGTHGRSGLSHLLLGSVAERIVRSAPCPVLTVRHPEHEFIQPDNP